MTPIQVRYQETMVRKSKEQHRRLKREMKHPVERQRGRLAMVTAISLLLGAVAIIYAVTS